MRHTPEFPHSSTLVDAPHGIFKLNAIEPLDETAAAENQEDSYPEWLDDSGWVDGKDYPQFVNNDETWKTMKRCILSDIFKNADSIAVAEGGRRVMPSVIPVSPPMTEENLKKLREAVQGLNKAFAEGRAELRIFKAETLFTECACLSDDEVL